MKRLLKMLLVCVVGICGCGTVVEAGGGGGRQLWPMEIPDVVGEVPTGPVEFYRWVIVDRARSCLRRIRKSEDGLIYGASPEDANMAWVMAAAYDGEGWSDLYRDQELLDGGLRIMDAVTDVRLKEPWEKGKGHGPRFGLHAYANAVSFWKETGAVPEATMDRWIECVRRSAEFAIRYDARSLWVGQYANPEFYTLAGLAAAWELTGVERYRREARRTLRRYESQTFPAGGVAYMTRMNAQTNYQDMVVKSVARYHEITGDPYAEELLKRYARYYRLIALPAGIHSPSEQPWLKHNIIESINPAVPDMLASLTGDGRCETIGRAQAFRRAEQIARRWPSFRDGEGHFAWYNYHHTTFAVLALRYHRDVEPEPLESRRVGKDENLRGIRARWDGWMASVTSRRASMTLAGCLISDPSEPFFPLESGLLFFLTEYAEGEVERYDSFRLPSNHFILSGYTPLHSRSVLGDGAILNVFSPLSSPYWGTFPESSAEHGRRNPGAWEYCQAWITWRNGLIGMVRMAARRKSEEAGFVRMRPVFYPRNRELRFEVTGDRVEGACGRLGFAMSPLGTTEGWEFGRIENREEAPYFKGGSYYYIQPVSPVYEKTGGTWKRGDSAALWTAYWDREDPAVEVSDPAEFQAKFLADRAGAVIVREGERSVMAFAANLQRRWVQLQVDPAEGWEVELVHDGNELPTFPGEPVRWSLSAFHTSVLRIRGAGPVTAAEVSDRLRVTGGRWPWTLPDGEEPYPWSPPY